MQKTPLNMGIGLNPIFTSHPEFIPDFIDFVECGPDDLPKLTTSRLAKNLSLHIARSPICEDVVSQDKFISAIAAKTKNHDFTSVGLHVTGPRLSGIGCYGFSSHYTPSKENEELISGFVKKIQDKFGKPVWLENVNFYSESKGAVFRVHESINQIAERCQASQIADLTHLYVDAHNVGVDETALIGAINWADEFGCFLYHLTLCLERRLRPCHLYHAGGTCVECRSDCLSECRFFCRIYGHESAAHRKAENLVCLNG